MRPSRDASLPRSAAQPAVDGRGSDADRPQLLARHHAVLRLGELDEGLRRRGPVHMTVQRRLGRFVPLS
jgi:hypothetical protein